MNEDRMKGAATDTGGKVKEAYGNVTGDREAKGEGIVDQVKGTAQNLYGNAKDAVESAYDKAGPAVRQTADRAVSTVKDAPVLGLVAAGAIGYAIAYALHAGMERRGRRDDA